MSEFWREKHVLITGATSGIGRALAQQAIERGAKVSAIGRREALLQELAGKLGDKLIYEAADVGEREPLLAAVSRLVARHGPVDVLIASAGVYRKTDGAAFDPARAEQVFRTNVIGVSNALGAVLPEMVARKSGSVCAVASQGAWLSLPAGGAYCASKAAVATLMKSVCLDVEPHGVQATTVFPGFVDTPMITDHERQTERGIVTPEYAAARILRAIEHRQRICIFPLSMFLKIKLASLLVWPIYRLAMRSVPPMEET